MSHVQDDLSMWVVWYKNRDTQVAYDNYRLQNISKRALCIVLVLGTFLQIMVSLFMLSPDVAIIATHAFRCLILIPGWTFFRQVVVAQRNDSCSPCFVSARLMGDICACTFVLTAGLHLIARSYVGECDAGQNTYSCNTNAACNSPPTDAVISVIIYLIGVQVLFKPRPGAMLIAWLIAVISLIIAVILSHSAASPLVFVIALATLGILYELEKNLTQSYIALRNAEHSIRTRMHAENEKQVMEMRSVEMRHLLGNVAHDLKTPMQSFVLDLEYLDKKLKNPLQRTAEYVAYSLDEMRRIMESVQNLIDTNSFMYMVINRAIDYTKSSSGHVLVPSLETINVTESIQWAINIVKTKSRVPIIFEPLPVSVCSNIITDKQWLIENILCLVSNAAKFTMHGSVTIRCELQSETNADHPVHTPHHDDIAAAAYEESECESRFGDVEDGTRRVVTGSNVSCNSAASTTGGGGEKSVSMISLELSQPTQQQWLVIEVEDTGIGIPADKKEFMFQPFKQAMRMAGGTGLGLYSMSLRVKALGGECGLSDNKHGEYGTCFWFKLPYRADVVDFIDNYDALEAYDGEVKQSNENNVSLPHNTQLTNHIVTPRSTDTSVMTASSAVSPRITSGNILLADDSLTIRKSITRVLTHENLSVDLAENGQMALEMIALKKYDLVLMDLQMPVMDGLEAVRRLRELENEAGNCNHLTVIGISAYNGEPYCSEALKAGMDGFIEKPFTTTRFFEYCSLLNVVL